MNALNEVNKVITSVSYYTHRHSQMDDDEWLTAEKMAVSFALRPQASATKKSHKIAVW